MPDFPIKTARLVLRPFEPHDLDDLHAYRSQPEVHRYLYSEAQDREQTRELIAERMACTELSDEGQKLWLAVYWPEQGRVVGDVVLKWLSKVNRQGEIGYGFNPEFQGKGLATEAAEALLEFGFGHLNLHRIIAQCDPRDEPSWRLMERLGMRREAHFRHNEIFKGEWGDLYVYAMLAQEYQRLK
ncbi:GNAT family N-acetyltransferase [Lentzea sp. NPDC005914]|uniref:GNAT family N-acetyltransferase n=1 Tax=Lentzea sp. NPDC005914 TaxID=3154572 RepID=UPI00340C3B7F